MKTFLTLIALVAASQSFATTTDLREGDLAISPITDAKIVSVKSMCPAIGNRPRCMAFGSMVKIKVGLNGCMDRLGGYVAKFEHADMRADTNAAKLNFVAFNVANKLSRTARCVKQPTAIVDVFVPHEGKVELAPMSPAAYDSVKLTKSDVAVTQAARVKIASIEPMCPATVPNGAVCMAFGSIVKLKVTVAGCMDKVGPVTSSLSYNVEGNKPVLSVSALNIVNEGSRVALCDGPRSTIVSIPVSHTGKLTLETLEFNGTNVLP